MKIIKRDGKKVGFDSWKIHQAMRNVFQEFNNYDLELVEDLTSQVENNIKENYDEPSVEKIQDEVEDVLIDNGFKKEARTYIKYREKHAQKRKEWLKNDLPLSIWMRKYQFEDENFQEFFDRVSGGNERIKKLIKNKKFLYAGRILANRGLKKFGINVTYSNCYVSSPPEDNLESINDSAYKLERTFSYGGGSGIDISKLRPRGAKVNNAAKTTSGAVSFIDKYDVSSRIIGQKGRRAALMISLSCEHPDVEEFIEKKLDLDAVNKANISVRLTDDFMKAAENKEMLPVEFDVEDTEETIKAELDADKLLNKLAYGNWYSGEPGALFWDRIENYSFLDKHPDFEYAGTNPCGEEPLPAGGSCLLGAINLSEFVENEFKENAEFNYEEFIRTIEIAVEGLNEVLDEGLPLHPLAEQRSSAKRWRQIGLGVMGFGSMLIKLGIRYGSKESIELIHAIGSVMANNAIKTSALLAKKNGTFPAYNEEAILDSNFLNSVADYDTMELVKKYGLRNSQLMTIAPTGSISNICGVSGGMEPIYQISYTRKTESLHGEDKEYEIFSPVVRKLIEEKDLEIRGDLPNYVIDAHQLNYEERIAVQSAWQKFIDASISSTVNLENDVTVDEIKDLYIKAWKEGLKGITVFREGCARAGVLSSDKGNKKSKEEMADQDWIDNGICPNCKSTLNMTGGCRECEKCGFQLCGI